MADRLGTAAMASLLGITPQRLNALAGRGVIPKASRGRWCPAEAVPAYCAHLREQAAGRGDGLGLDLVAERARLAARQAEKVELELALKRGAVVDAGEIRQEMTAMITAAKSKLLAVPSKARGRLSHLTVNDVEFIEGLVHEALEELANGTE